MKDSVSHTKDSKHFPFTQKKPNREIPEELEALKNAFRLNKSIDKIIERDEVICFKSGHEEINKLKGTMCWLKYMSIIQYDPSNWKELQKSKSVQQFPYAFTFELHKNETFVEGLRELANGLANT